MVYTEINNSIIGMEIRKLNNLDKFGNFSDLITYYYLKRCKHTNCGNCESIIYIENFQENEENAMKELQNFCTEYFGHFVSLLTLVSSLAIIGDKSRT